MYNHKQFLQVFQKHHYSRYVCFLCDLTQVFNQTYCRSSGVKQTGFNWIAGCWTMTFPKRLDHLSLNSKSGQFRFTHLHGQWLTNRGRYQHSMRHAGATSTCKSKTYIAGDKRRFGIEIDNNFLFISLYITLCFNLFICDDCQFWFIIAVHLCSILIVAVFCRFYIESVAYLKDATTVELFFRNAKISVFNVSDSSIKIMSQIKTSKIY